MRIVCILVLFVACFFSACKKEPINDQNDSASADLSQRSRRFPKLPKPLLPLTICINSYDELIQLLGTDNLIAKAAVLANGAIMQPGSDLQNITYEAIAQNQPNSLFGSRLIVEWRWPGGNWQLNISDVWSLGCVYTVSGEPPYTNLIKDGNIIQINTCFFWGTNEFTGERIDYVIID